MKKGGFLGLGDSKYKDQDNRKPFKETIAGKIVGGIIKTVGRSIPLFGDITENLRSKDGGDNRLCPEKLVTQIIRLTVFALLVWQFAKGNVSITQLLAF